MTDTRPRLPAVVLISGRGSNMQAIAERALAGKLAIDIRAVVSDREEAGGLRIARRLGYATRVVPARAGLERSQYDAALAAALREYRPRVVLFAGFMRIVTATFVEEFAGRMLNIHPSLLPQFRGLETHRRAIESHAKAHGASVHFVTLELDGGPVVLQGRLSVRPDDNPDSLAARVLRLEHRIYPQAIGWLADGRLEWNDGRVRFDGVPLAAPIVIEEQDL